MTCASPMTYGMIIPFSVTLLESRALSCRTPGWMFFCPFVLVATLHDGVTTGVVSRCMCGRTFTTPQAYKCHTCSYTKKKKRLSCALAKVKEVWVSNMRRRTGEIVGTKMLKMSDKLVAAGLPMNDAFSPSVHQQVCTDIVKPGNSHRNFMLLADRGDGSDTYVSHPFLYAQVLGAYHAWGLPSAIWTIAELL
jgi:hypothetical protein